MSFWRPVLGDAEMVGILKGRTIVIAALALAVIAGAYLWCATIRVNQQWDLSTAAATGDMSTVEKLVHQGTNVNALPPDTDGAGPGLPALLVAAENGHENVVRFLLEHGANIELKVEDTPLLMACIKGHDSIAKLLLDHGANPNARGEGTPLSVAEERQDSHLVELLKSHGAR
jgi:ankyrin repeat protein